MQMHLTTPSFSHGPPLQAQVLLEARKVPVGVEEWQIIFDAPRGEEHIDRSANGDAFGAEETIMFSGLFGDGHVAQIKINERFKAPDHRPRFGFGWHAAQDFMVDEIRQQHFMIVNCCRQKQVRF
jgi:hypothetical protein